VGKKPQTAAQPGPGKRPVQAVPDPNDVVKDQPLTWGHRFLDLSGDWSWRKLDAAHAEKLHCILVGVEGKTLHSLLRSKKIKDIPVEHMKEKAKERLLQMGLEEAEVLYEIRLGHKKWRIWGLVEGSVFLLLWWDEFETACHRVPKGQKRR
jgi:hypothetical protein